MANQLLRLLFAAAVTAALLVTFSIGTQNSAWAGTSLTVAENTGNDTAKVVDKKLPSPDDFIAYETAPVKLNEPVAAYPDSAMKAGIEGRVWVKVLIDKQGTVRDALIVKDSGKKVGFEESALTAAKQATWKPATQKGEPIAVWVSYEVKFALK